MATKSCLHRCPHTSVSVYLLPLHSWQEKGRSLSLKVSFKKFWLGQELSDLFVQCEFEHGLFFIVLLQLLWLETYSSVWFYLLMLLTWEGRGTPVLGAYLLGLLLQQKRSLLFVVMLILEVCSAQWHSELQLALVLSCWCVVQLNTAWI